MKALVLEEIGKPMVVRNDWPEPKCPDDGAIVRVEGSGICRSDWHLWQGDWGWIGFKPRLPAVLGHEFAGVIEEVGKDVKNLKRGARVVVPLAQGCGVCDDCRVGYGNHCSRSGGMTGYAQYGVLHHADFNHAPLPEGIDFVEASSMGCRYVTAFHGLLDQGHVQADETVVVYGCGGVGLSAVQIAAALGARVIAVDLDDRKLELAKQVGATDVINGKKTDPVKAVRDLTNGGADVSVDALGIEATCRNAVMSLRKRGRHIQIGLTTQKEKGEVALPIDQIVFREIQFVGSLAIQSFRYPALLDMVQRGRLAPRKLITETIPIEKAFGVLEQMSKFENVGISVINQF
ncbi:MAG TPA: zinc-binding dehydrogenase [Candidatus Binataceae bacterium]|nr:zinc-binding dehydrogenase [Candidatus Binataceae bacterium]